MNPNYPFVARRAKHRCEYCHAPEIVFNVAFEVDHIIPLSQNGSDTEQNWALSCRICNLRKLDHTCGFDPISQTTIRLFNPRLELWHENFLGSPKTPFFNRGNNSYWSCYSNKIRDEFIFTVESEKFMD